MITAMLSLLLAAQQPADTTGRPCEVAIDRMPRVNTSQQGRATNYFSGGGVRAHCQGTSTTLAADSFAWFSAQGRLDLVGQVKIRDTTLNLDANFVSYFTNDERLEAHNNVVAVNRSTGSVLRGPNLTYFRIVKGVRDTIAMFATGRPTIEYRQPGEGGGGPDEPYIVVGDRVRLKGDDRVWAGGRVTIDRSDLAARGDSMALDETAGFGVLLGKPRMEGKSGKPYTLVGTRIELGLAKREIHLVKALGAGEASGTDWRLSADTIHLGVENRKLQRAFAWGTKSRPYAVSTLNTIKADSLALDIPDEVLTEVRAFRKALSTSKRDSTAVAADIDWIAGDSITARFAQEKDSAGALRTRIHQILARGAARALTHHYDARDSTAAGGGGGGGGPAINYSRGQVIDIALKDQRLELVTVTGRADGLHLEPRPPAPPDSAKRDTTGTRRKP